MADADLTTLGKYQIVRTLGRGAMGIVYEGFDPIIARRVAIKTVRLDRIDDSEAAEDLLRFKREAQAAGRLTHPNIVGVYDYGETDTLAYIVMEFVEGDTLKSLLDRGERFTPDAAVAMMEALLAGLAYSHEHGVIHRDIKPANVMVTTDNRVKLADFGVARIESSSLTQAGTMIGTPSYMSPEQFMGQTIDARTDIYSSGVLLYQLLTGEKPFDGSVTAIMHKVLNVEPPAPSRLSVSVSPGLDGVVHRAMAKRPEDRFASAREFASSLRTAESAIDADATMVAPAVVSKPASGPAVRTSLIGPGLPRDAGHGLVPVLVGAVVLAVAAIAAYLLLGSKPEPYHAASPTPKPVAAPKIVPPAPSTNVPPARATNVPPARATNVPPARATNVPPARATNVPPARVTSLASQRRKLAAAIAPIDCTLVHGTLTDQGATLGGVASDATRAALIQAAAAAIAPLPLTTTLRGFTGPYCGLIDAVRTLEPPFTAPTDQLRQHLAHHATRLVEGKTHFVVVDVTVPSWSAYVVVDYVDSSGAIARMYPNPKFRSALHPAGSRFIIGIKPGQQFNVGKPFGRDMILAIASSIPIDPLLPKPQASKVASFLPVLQAALAKLKAGSAKVAASVILVDTVRPK